MQYFGSMSTAPSGASKVAPTGQTCTQGECSHKLQSLGTKNALTSACVGKGKVYWAEDLGARREVDLAQSWFYTDSYTDMPMLERVGNQVVVNPDPRLKRTAKRRGWPVQDWRHAEPPQAAPPTELSA